MQTHIFNSAVSVSFRDDGFLNATAIAAHFGKVAKDYLKTEQTQQYIAALAEFLSKGTKIPLEENQIVSVKKGGNDSGTWLHPKLAIHFARWLDAKFAVWCDMKIEEILGIKQTAAHHSINEWEQHQIQVAVKQRSRRTGETTQAVYTKLHTYMECTSYLHICQKDFQAAMNFLAGIQDAPELFIQPESQGILFTEQQIHQFAVLTYYAQHMGLLLEDLSSGLRRLGSNHSGRAYDLANESHAWLIDCQRSLMTAFKQMQNPAHIQGVKNIFARMM